MARAARRAVALLTAWLALGAAPGAPAAPRIVSLDGTTTETIAALGAADELVGRDDSSTYPSSIARLPSVGYQFTLSAEGILSLRPTLVVGRDDVQPAAAVQQVRNAGVCVALIPPARTLAAAEQRIRTIGALLDRDAEATHIVAGMQREGATLQREIAARGGAPQVRVLVFLAISSQAPLGCGPQSGPGAMLALADAANALPAMRSCKPVTPEAIVGAAPEAIVTLTSGGRDESSGAPSLASMTTIAQTPAGRTQRLFTFDGLFFAGFGPRAAQAALDLFNALYRAH